MAIQRLRDSPWKFLDSVRFDSLVRTRSELDTDDEHHDLDSVRERYTDVPGLHWRYRFRGARNRHRERAMAIAMKQRELSLGNFGHLWGYGSDK